MVKQENPRNSLPQKMPENKTKKTPSVYRNIKIITMCRPNSERWKTSVFWIHRTRNTRKREEERRVQTIFRAFIVRWTQENTRFLEFTRIDRPRKQHETPEKHRRTPEYSLFSEFWRFGEHWKTGVFFNSLEFTVPENVRKHSKTLVNGRLFAVFRA